MKLWHELSKAERKLKAADVMLERAKAERAQEQRRHIAEYQIAPDCECGND